jgi:hypothetical protein
LGKANRCLRIAGGGCFVPDTCKEPAVQTMLQLRTGGCNAGHRSELTVYIILGRKQSKRIIKMENSSTNEREMEDGTTKNSQ